MRSEEKRTFCFMYQRATLLWCSVLFQKCFLSSILTKRQQFQEAVSKFDFIMLVTRRLPKVFLQLQSSNDTYFWCQSQKKKCYTYSYTTSVIFCSVLCWVLMFAASSSSSWFLLWLIIVKRQCYPFHFPFCFWYYQNGWPSRLLHFYSKNREQIDLQINLNNPPSQKWASKNLKLYR